MATKAPRGRRPAGSPDARAAILDAAVELFAESGYDRTTIRAVASRAEVDPALVYHYFGDKQGLLSEAISLPADPRALFSGLAEKTGPVGSDLVLGVLSLYESDPDALKRLVALLRTALSYEGAADLLRTRVEDALLAALSGLAAGDETQKRTGLVLSQVIGLLFTRHIVKAPPMVAATREELAAAIGPTIDRYLTGPLS
jgi:AcrR family transcriptional regulator